MRAKIIKKKPRLLRRLLDHLPRAARLPRAAQTVRWCAARVVVAAAAAAESALRERVRARHEGARARRRRGVERKRAITSSSRDCAQSRARESVRAVQPTEGVESVAVAARHDRRRRRRRRRAAAAPSPPRRGATRERAYATTSQARSMTHDASCAMHGGETARPVPAPPPPPHAREQARARANASAIERVRERARARASVDAATAAHSASAARNS